MSGLVSAADLLGVLSTFAPAFVAEVAPELATAEAVASWVAEECVERRWYSLRGSKDGGGNGDGDGGGDAGTRGAAAVGAPSPPSNLLTGLDKGSFVALVMVADHDARGAAEPWPRGRGALESEEQARRANAAAALRRVLTEFEWDSSTCLGITL
jgi:hypothetical protein